MVMRETQVSSPASLTMSICHTCVVRPMCTARAVPVTQPLLAALLRRDRLQAVQQLVRDADLDFAVQFVNYR